MHLYLTAKQKLILSTIKDLTTKFGKSPTLEEIRKELGYATISSVQRHLDALKKKGVLSNEKNYSRSLEINLDTEKYANIPLVGNVACGQPFLAEQNIEAYIPYDRSKLRGDPDNFFFLRAVGDSMDQAGIDDGDFVLIKKQQTADLNEKIVALIGDEATVKKLKKGDGFYILQPQSSNPQNKPIYVIDDLQIQGVVKDILKKGGQNG
ncbi:MAG: transcriptional repressor LexA [Patescibacteria group bacterium]|nr:transcriptional repressor LexA [Patescibacteria group bacterium]